MLKIYGEEKVMSTLLFASLLALPECPQWISEDSSAVAPAGVQVEDMQKIKNKMRCYQAVMVPWKGRCAPNEKSRCKELIDRWLEKNFTVLEAVSPSCPGHNRKTFMLNVRTSP